MGPATTATDRANDARGRRRRATNALSLYYRDVSRHPLLPHAEQRALARLAREGDRDARDRLVACNLRLVVSTACRFQGHGLDLDDLIQEGNLGLFDAAARFDPDRGTRFSTYATWWIRQRLSDALRSKARTVRLPNYVIDLLNRWRPAAERLRGELGREPDPAEVGAAVGLARRPRALRGIVAALALADRPHLDADQHALDDRRAREPWQALADAELPGTVRRLVDSLALVDARAPEIVRRRLGLDGPRETLKAVGERFGLTRERVRQIEWVALGALRRELEAEGVTG